MTKPPAAMRALKMVHDEARQGREAAEALTPLLALLDPAAEGQGGPLQEVTDLLTTILTTQQSILQVIEALSSRVDALGQGQR
ncbi:hypothetical protein [Mesorhizobium sophorae]|uniref:hypothetical protein n=1 Tax=Mesorhizobium sophorae TaxID=1300294 RepID=UPI000BA4AF3A|nr:hypothetical protein [Mesorhizobium sophorae]